PLSALETDGELRLGLGEVARDERIFGAGERNARGEMLDTEFANGHLGGIEGDARLVETAQQGERAGTEQADAWMGRLQPAELLAPFERVSGGRRSECHRDGRVGEERPLMASRAG